MNNNEVPLFLSALLEILKIGLIFFAAELQTTKHELAHVLIFTELEPK